MAVLMKCGHTANATIEDRPCCAICVGLTPDAEIVDEKLIDLTGRKAKCSQHRFADGGIVDSDLRLAFFKHNPDAEYDSYYCGCWGWN